MTTKYSPRSLLKVDHSIRGFGSIKSSFGKLTETRLSRIILLIGAWLFIRELSSRSSGFEDGPILCPIRLLTGFPCPGCGGTRAIGAICNGQFERAWELNPLSFLVVAIFVGWALQSATINKFLNSGITLIRSRSQSIQFTLLFFTYVAAWIAALYRFNPGIF